MRLYKILETTSTGNPYENLAHAIIRQAVYDYRDALKKLKKDEKDIKALATKSEVEQFFHSKWYGILTGIDADFVLERVRAEFDVA